MPPIEPSDQDPLQNVLAAAAAKRVHYDVFLGALHESDPVFADRPHAPKHRDHQWAARSFPVGSGLPSSEGCGHPVRPARPALRAGCAGP